MSDFVYLLITLVSFAALALVVGFLDRRLGDASDEYADPLTVHDEPTEPAHTEPAPTGAGR